MIRGALAKGKRVLFLVNRRELVKDLSRRLDKLGLDHGVIMGDHPRRKPWLSVFIASVDTLYRRPTVPPADVIYLDEAHFSLSPVFLKVLDKYSGVPVIGMTATPTRMSGEGLGEIFQVMVMGPTVEELTEQGHLVPTRVFAPSQPDLKGVRSSAGDYNQKELATVMDRAKLTGDIVEHWKKLASNRPTVCFCVNVEHSRHVAEQFRAAGVRAEHVDADTPDDIRDQLWEGLAEFRVQVICSVGVISYGWDVPPVSAAILARPTQSLALYLQQVGRILRPAPGKHDALILDHAGNTLRHGFVTDDREWSLEGSRKRNGSKQQDRSLSVHICAQCWMAYPSRLPKCPGCGAAPEARDRRVEVEDGELTEVRPDLRCTNCKRALVGAKHGEPCVYCRRGYMRRPYVIKKLSRNPVIARLQQEAQEKGYDGRWIYMQMQLRRKMA
jgi:superfamily II DNA or RNA helicase